MIAQGGSRSAIRLARHSVECCAGKSRRAPSTFAARPPSCNLHTCVATNSTSLVLLLTTATSRRTATRAPRCGPTTLRSPGPASFRNSLRSNALVMTRGDASDDRPCGPEHISPLRVRQRVAALMRGIARHVTMIIRMRDDAGQRSAARNSSLRYIFGRTIPCRQYAVVTVQPTALPYVPGSGASTYWRVFRRRRDGVIKSLYYPEVKHAELHPGRVFGAVRLTRTLPEASAQERRDARLVDREGSALGATRRRSCATAPTAYARPSPSLGSGSRLPCEQA
jgi:hypothetical protein